jgi:hypothetical protein
MKQKNSEQKGAQRNPERPRLWKNYQFFLFPKVSFKERGKDQRGFLDAGRARIVIGSFVKGLIPVPDFLAFTSFLTKVPMIGNRTRSPEAAALAPLWKASSMHSFNSFLFNRI